MKLKPLGFIGGGRITRILLQGLSNKKTLPEIVKVYEPNAEILKALQTEFPKVIAADSALDAATQELVFIAVHPPLVMDILQEIKAIVNESTIIISLAPKITLKKMADVLPTNKLARMIPNATSFINEGYNPITFSPDFQKEEKKQLIKLLRKLGKTFETEEVKLESYAIASAMLPTYFWFQWQEMEKIAQEIGMTQEEAEKTISSTLKKALKLYYKSGLSSGQVLDLIPVKPIGKNEPEIKNILNTKLIGLFEKIKP